MLPCVPACRISAGNIEPGRIVQRAGVIADGDDLQPVLMQLQRGVGADIAKALDHGGAVPGLIDSSFSTRLLAR